MSAHPIALLVAAAALTLPFQPAHAQDHSGHVDHAAMGHTAPGTETPVEPVPPLTDADRAAAFPDIDEHLAHETRTFAMLQLERLETWRKKVDARASGAGYSYTTDKGSSARLDFRGRSILFVSLRGPNQGKVKVIVDGVKLGRFNLARATTEFGAIIARKSWDENDRHRIRIVADSGKRVVFDTYVVIK